MAPTATLTHTGLNGGTPLNLICESITAGLQCNNTSPPADNKDFGLVEVQTKSIENPIITISGLQLRTDVTNAFNESHMVDFAQFSYNGGNAATLNVTYGKEGATRSLSLLGGTSNIKVVFESGSIPIDLNASDDGYVPITQMVLKETL